MKGAFSAGVTDAFLDAGIDFDLYLGVSAGAANLASFAAHQRGRTYAFYLGYAMRSQYMSVSNFLKKGSYFDFDYIFTTLTNRGGEYPIDYPELMRNPGDVISVTTNALSGRPVYWHKDCLKQDQYEVFKATCSIPWLCSPRILENLPMVDGTISDPLPVKKALELGAELIVVVMPNSTERLQKGAADQMVIDLLKHSRKTAWMPGLEKAMSSRTDHYNEGLDLLEQLEKESRAIIVIPDDGHHVKALSRNKENLEALYEEGMKQGRKAAKQILEKLAE